MRRHHPPRGLRRRRRISRLRLPLRRTARPRPRPPPNPLFHPRPGRSPVTVRMSPQRFEELVGDALDLIPPDLASAIDNVVVLVEGRTADEPDLLGLYHGIALTERDSWYAGSLPDTITIYRDALLDV